MRIPDVEAQESEEETARHIQEIMKQGRTRFETRHRCKDGQLLDIEVSTVFTPDEESGPVFLRDITARKQAELQLKNSERRYRQIIQTSMDGFWITDTEGRILEVNDAYC